MGSWIGEINVQPGFSPDCPSGTRFSWSLTSQVSGAVLYYLSITINDPAKPRVLWDGYEVILDGSVNYNHLNAETLLIPGQVMSLYSDITNVYGICQTEPWTPSSGTVITITLRGAYINPFGDQGIGDIVDQRIKEYGKAPATPQFQGFSIADYATA